MLTVSSKFIYSLSAILELSLHPKGHCVQIKEIACAQNIPISFLEQILMQLKNAGLVKSTRGAQGGYQLTKSPAEIKIADILAAVHSPVNLTSTTTKENVINDFLEDCQHCLKERFNTTILQLIEKRKQREEQNMYYI
jgi:Rrf2 family protein